jgi:hypothetical protein
MYVCVSACIYVHPFAHEHTQGQACVHHFGHDNTEGAKSVIRLSVRCAHMHPHSRHTFGSLCGVHAGMGTYTVYIHMVHIHTVYIVYIRSVHACGVHTCGVHTCGCMVVHRTESRTALLRSSGSLRPSALLPQLLRPRTILAESLPLQWGDVTQRYNARCNETTRFHSAHERLTMHHLKSDSLCDA